MELLQAVECALAAKPLPAFQINKLATAIQRIANG